MSRVLAIFLDGYEQSLGRHLMLAGEMPELSRLAATSGRFLLDHGAAQRSGLAGEHLATGMSPEAAQRWSAVHFDPRSYAVWQEGARFRPFPADLPCRTVVFDAPYFDLDGARAVRGVVNWGAHDPGVAPTSRPSGLFAEVTEQFGPYPAGRWIYGLAWPSLENSREMGSELSRAVEVRADAAHWLLSERTPDWDLAIIAVSEAHSAIEGLWHGIDATHPLHQVPGAALAGAGIRKVYHAIDRLVGKLTSAFPDALTVVFAMGGMGANQSDVPSMLLLPELMYRHAFGSTFFQQPPEWIVSAGESPLLSADTTSWEVSVSARFPNASAHPAVQRGTNLRKVMARMLPPGVKRLIRRAEGSRSPRLALTWMPAMAYQEFWHTMPAFALPSFYDGRIRLNLIGREKYGVVQPGDYQGVVAGVEMLIRRCIDPATGESAVDYVEYPAPGNPRELEATQADFVVIWKGAPICLDHPSLGRIGPAPYRRTGGHTGPYGMAYIRANRISVGDHGIRSAFDVVPTIIDLTGSPQPQSLSGKSLLPNLQDGGESELGRAASVRPFTPYGDRKHFG